MKSRLKFQRCSDIDLYASSAPVRWFLPHCASLLIRILLLNTWLICVKNGKRTKALKTKATKVVTKGHGFRKVHQKLFVRHTFMIFFIKTYFHNILYIYLYIYI